MQSTMRLGSCTELHRPSAAFTCNPRRLQSPARQLRTAVVAQSEQQRKRVALLVPASLVATNAGAALAEAVKPSGAGIPVAGGASGAGASLSVDSAVNSVIDAVKAAGGVVQQGLDVAGTGVQYAKEALDTASPYIKSASDTVGPYVKTAVDTVKDVAGPAFRQAQPQLQSGVTEAQKLLQQQGLDTNAVAGASRNASQQASGVFDQLRPAFNSALTFVTTTPPDELAKYAAIAVGTYYLAPPVLGVVFGGLRGYAGDISAPAALDLVSTRNNTYIIDLRSDREKESAGSLDIPGNGRLIELPYAAFEDRKLRGQLRNVPALELQTTALLVASLKKLGKGSTILLVDRNGSTSKAVAKQLRAKGFRRAFVVASGFGGWTAAKLRVKPSSSVSRVEVLPAVGNPFGTLSRTVSGRGNSSGGGRRALPSGR